MAKKSKTSMKKKSAPAKTAKSSSSAAMETLPKVRQASKPRNTGTMTYTQSEVIENLRAFCGMPKRVPVPGMNCQRPLARALE